MTLVAKSWDLVGGSGAPSSPQLLLSSSLVKRQVLVRMSSVVFLSDSNSNTDGFRASTSGESTFTFAVPAGDALYAWCLPNQSGAVSILSSTELL